VTLWAVRQPAPFYSQIRIVIFGNCVPGTHFRRKHAFCTNAHTHHPRRRLDADIDGRLPLRGVALHFGGVAKRIAARYSLSLVLAREVEGARLSRYVFYSAKSVGRHPLSGERY